MGEKVKYCIYMAIFRPLSWLPLCVLYGLSNLLCFVFRHILHYRRNVIRENLTTCYPEKTEDELRKIEAEFYRQLGDNIVETIKLLNISDSEVLRRIKVKGAQQIEAAADENRPIILYLGHYCNWEWMSSITYFYSRPKYSAQLYKPLHDKAFDEVMKKIRSRFGSVSIDKNKAFREMLRLAKTEGAFVVGFIADNRLSWVDTHHYTTFLRHHTWFYPGGEEIGSRMNAAFFYLDITKPSRGHYNLEIKPIVPKKEYPDYPYTRRYLEMLEETIDRAPAYWLWSHKRWIDAKSMVVENNNSDNNKN